MTNRFMGFVPFIFALWLVWQPIIINSQPGNTFIYAGVDWKADNLDNTMFWIGILLFIFAIIGQGYIDREERNLKKNLQENLR